MNFWGDYLLMAAGTIFYLLIVILAGVLLLLFSYKSINKYKDNLLVVHLSYMVTSNIWAGIFILINPSVLPLTDLFRLSNKDPVFYIIGIIIAVFNIWVFKSVIKNLDNYKEDLLLLVFDLLEIILLFTIINYYMYQINPLFFNTEVNMSGKGMQILQFFFYTFTVAVTYANGAIQAVKIPSQIVQVAAVIVFYFVLANDIRKLIKK